MRSVSNASKAADAVFVMLMHSLLTLHCHLPVRSETRYLSDLFVFLFHSYLLRCTNTDTLLRIFQFIFLSI